MQQRAPSLVGRLRVAYDLARDEMLALVREAGHPDVTGAMITLFRLTGIDQRRPGEIAATARLSKQATNDFLRELERLRYVERHPDPSDGRARIMKLTKRGHELDAAVWAAGRNVERSWAARIDRKRMATFNEVLDELIAGHDRD
ncbi:MarR family [Gaiella occulta]|uniref:MarR family n=1 Tax=Gaiella occulta TaxID=1002870 RepID=A0A7M2Z0K0_9ACTN|nr:MarR family winged helix-turn-helix transcriptional regulator [Gaiella occulta]RDI75331.1 MarR family [Gaiella occulta]